MNINETVIKEFWSLFGQAQFDQAAELMHPEAIIRWCNTREIFRNRDKFIVANKMYPGRWHISLEQILSSGNVVISVIKAECHESSASFYATSFFNFTDGLISEITEYWGENGEPQEWRVREQLSEIY